MRIWLALRTFFQVLTNRDFASGVEQLQLAGPAEPAALPEPTPEPEPPAPQPPARSEAVTLLATLQREARLVDMVSESLDGYSDAQVGAAARDVLRDCGQVLGRLFALEPLATQDEGQTVEVPAEYDASQYRLVGSVGGQGPFSGTLQHAGWRATKCELPTWSGSDSSALVVAPAEVQIG